MEHHFNLSVVQHWTKPKFPVLNNPGEMAAEAQNPVKRRPPTTRRFCLTELALLRFAWSLESDGMKKAAGPSAMESTSQRIQRDHSRKVIAAILPPQICYSWTCPFQSLNGCQENRFAIFALISCCVGQTSSLLSNGIITLLAFCTNYDMNAVLLRGDVHAVDGSHHQLLPMKEFPRFWVRRLVDSNLKSAAPLNWFPGPLEVHL
jgi:hypothetical protein